MQVAVKFVLIFLCKAKILSVRDLTLVQGARIWQIYLDNWLHTPSFSSSAIAVKIYILSSPWQEPISLASSAVLGS